MILAIFSRYLGLAIPFLGIALYFLQRFYLRTSRQVRLLGIEARAPLYTHFTESIAGASTIRAFGWQAHYRELNCRYIDTSQRPTYLQSCIQAWLQFVVNIIVAALAVILVATVIIWHETFSAGSVGVSLVMVIGLSETIAMLIQSWTQLESSIGAVTRVKWFAAETESEECGDERGDLPPAWPQAGTLSFEGVVASYT
jgi:ATP-binding cassette subfamily C (CFTR/MRP) protein 1